MLHHAYRFASREVAAAALLDAPPAAEIDEIGLAYAPSTEGPDGTLSGGAALDGWHVNAIWPEAEPFSWAAARIDPAEAPRWWAGLPRVAEATPLPVPTSVSRFQARAALHLAGLLPAVEAAIAGSGNVVAQLAWADAVQFDRQSPTIAAMGGALGLTDAQVDDLFRAAVGIVA